jgi:hypothetical protein
MLAGCTVAGPADPGTAGHPARTASASPASSAALSLKQRAQADAAAILADFAVPPGAKRLSAPPASLSPELGKPFEEPGTPNLADKDLLWEAPGTPAAVLAWEEQHVPRQFARGGNISVINFFGELETGDTFSLPAIPEVLDIRELMVEVVAAGGRQTAIRVDAYVAWIPPKPAGAVVPSAAAVVTLSLNDGGDANGAKPPAPVTITDPATVRKVTAVIDGVPPSSGGTDFGCPPFGDGILDLVFRARPSRPVLATAVLQLYGCEWVDLTVGERGYALGNAGDARSTATQVLKAADVSWALPPDPD